MAGYATGMVRRINGIAYRLDRNRDEATLAQGHYVKVEQWVDEEWQFFATVPTYRKGFAAIYQHQRRQQETKG